MDGIAAFKAAERNRFIEKLRNFGRIRFSAYTQYAVGRTVEISVIFIQYFGRDAVDLFNRSARGNMD